MFINKEMTNDPTKIASGFKLSNFLFAHDSIKSNLPTSLCNSTTLVNNKHSRTSRNQEANQVNIPTVRTKTIGSNSIKSKSANIWNYISINSFIGNSLFIKREVSVNLC